MTRAAFLALDGLDAAGKSTQSRLLVDWLESHGHPTTACADPGGTWVGDRLRALLIEPGQALSLPCEALLFMASRAQLVADVIRPALEAGRVVVADRFLLANVVYQGHAGGLDPETLWQVGRFATGGLEPDLTLVFDLPLEEAVRRRGRPADRIESRSADYHARVRAGFLAEAQRRPDRIRVIDAGRAVQAVHEAIVEEVARVVGTSPRA
jgi:dTMP kinase